MTYLEYENSDSGLALDFTIKDLELSINKFCLLLLFSCVLLISCSVKTLQVVVKLVYDRNKDFYFSHSQVSNCAFIYSFVCTLGLCE